MAVVSLPIALSLALSPAVVPARPALPGASLLAPTSITLPPMLAPSLAPALSLAPSLAAASIPAQFHPTGPLNDRTLNSFWDGFAPFDESTLVLPERPSLPLGAGEDDAPRLAPWLATKDAQVAAALDRAVVLAGRTKAGAKALDDAEKLLTDAPLTVAVKDLGRNYGEFDYVARKLRLDRRLFEAGREADLAGTLVHELTHVVQHAQGVPSSALEMELEAHLQDLEMLRELGLEPPKNTFARQALDALKESPQEFIELVQRAVPGLVFLGEQDFDEIMDQLESDLDEASAKKSKAAQGLAAAIAKDIDLLSTKEGRASYRAFSRRVLKLLAERSSSLK